MLFLNIIKKIFLLIVRLILIGLIIYSSKILIKANVNILDVFFLVVAIVFLCYILFSLDVIVDFPIRLFSYLKYKFLKIIKKYPNIINEHLPDNAILRIEEDLLNKSRDIENIHKVLNQDINAVLINGKWGDGKTSISNLLKERIKEFNDFKFYEFNPWNISIEKNIISSFLDGLSNQFPLLKNNINNLRNLLIKNEKSFWFLELFFENNGLEKVKEKINKYFKYKKLLIIIDDLDRLSNREDILEVIKIVGEFEKYDNIKFLLLFDKYLIEEKIGQDGYLKKIIQHTYNIRISNNDIKKFFRNGIEKITGHNKIGSKLELALNNYFGMRNYDIMNGLFYYNLKNLRDCKLLLNKFKIKFNILEDEVNIKDLLELTVLETFYENIYLDIFENGEQLYARNYDSYIKENNDEKSFIKGNIELLIKKYGISEQDYIKGILFRLFPRIEQAFGVNISHKTGRKNWLQEMKIEDLSYFNKYFLEEIPKELSDKLLFEKLNKFKSFSNKERMSFFQKQYDFDNLFRVIGHLKEIDDKKYIIEWIIKEINKSTFKYEDSSNFLLNISELIQKAIDLMYHGNYDDADYNKTLELKTELYEYIISESKNILFLIFFVHYYIKKAGWNEINYKEFHENLKNKLKEKIEKNYSKKGNIYFGAKNNDKKYFTFNDIGLPSLFVDDFDKYL